MGAQLTNANPYRLPTSPSPPDQVRGKLSPSPTRGEGMKKEQRFQSAGLPNAGMTRSAKSSSERSDSACVRLPQANASRM